MVRAVARLKDAIETEAGVHVAEAEVELLLLSPVHRPHSLSRAEVADFIEPSEEEIEARAWGEDLSRSVWFYTIAAFFLALSFMSFAVITYALEMPTLKATLVFSSIGGVALALASSLFGVGLYRQYVVRGGVSWDHRQGYPDATVRRYKPIKKTWLSWSMYALGSLLLAMSVSTGVVTSRQLAFNVLEDYTPLRLGLLASTASGLSLFAIGAWPVIRSVVVMAEEQRRLGGSKYLAPPRLLFTLLPLFTGAASFLINWLFL